MNTERYDAHTVERKWQAVWDEAEAARVEDPGPDADRTQKSYVVEMWPYPSGSLHMGHVLVYTIGDVLSRFRRRKGAHVLHPIGFDSFGLPAENAALREGGHPREITERNIRTITQSMRRMGWAFDWTRLISAHEPTYYVWDQWLFLKLLEAGLAYRKGAPVKWCPVDQVVLANEQVHDGRCEYCGAEVIAKDLEQWFFRTTAYAQELLDELETIDWPDRIKAMQRNWIGRSEGAEILFRIEELEEDLPVFTTRPDTLYGATFFVLAPEHPLVERLAERSPHGDELRDYVRRAGVKRGEERAQAVEKTGVFTGFFATNPVNEARIPIWVADYVLMDYGTGAIMAVPAHDERDQDFAERFDLPIVPVIAEDGALIDSAQFSSMPATDAKSAIVGWLGERGRGKPAISYRLRDWGFSRQRYWGCPIPIVYCDDHGAVPVPESELPGAAAGHRGLQAEGRRAARVRRGLGARAVPDVWQGRPSRGRDDGHLRRLVLVLPALHRPAKRGRALASRPGELLEPGRPVHRRCRPRDDAHDLRALLHQGAERSRPGGLPRAVLDASTRTAGFSSAARRCRSPAAM